MSGHNKWSQIKHRKAATDASKARVFSRFARLITLESKKSGGDLNAPSLASAINRAKTANMPKDNIERAVAKGVSKDSGDLDEVVYEAYGPGGVALLVTALTDNRNRTTQEIKHLFSKQGIEISAPGAASWAFTKNPDGSNIPNEPLVELSEEDSKKLENLLDALDEHDDVQVVYTNAVGYASTGD